MVEDLVQAEGLARPRLFQQAAVALALAGYGVAMLPEFFQEKYPSLRRFPITDAAPVSYGVYSKALSGHPLRRAFVQLAKSCFLTPPSA